MATKTFNTRIANKRDTSANWTSNNPVLLNGEVIIVDTEAGQVRYKVGNGTSTYTQLPFTDESLITNINGKLSLSGGTMTGNIDMGGHKLTGLGAPVNPNDAVRQTDLKVVSDEVDGIISGTTGITLAPATTTKIGGIIVGDGIEVEADGTISTNPVPTGGTTGQVLTKTSTGEEWSDAPSGLPEGGTEGQVLTKTANGSAWENAPSGLPDGGTEGQMLYQGANGPEWGDKPVMYVTVTQSSDGSGHKVDKDAGEIKAAYEAGSSVFLVWDRNDLGKDDWQVIPLSAMDISANGNHYARFLNLNYSAVVDVDGDVDIAEVVFTSSQIAYNNSNSGLTSTNAQDAINEVQENVEKVLPSGGTTGQVLTKTSTGEEWSDAPSGLPEGGTEGQILEKTSSGAAWVDAPESGLTQEQADERYLQLSGGTLTGALTLNGEPTEDLQAATKQYVDNLVGTINTTLDTINGEVV